MENQQTGSLNKQVLGRNRAQVAEMFDDIAPRYDKLNRILSFRRDIRWRKKLVKELNGFQPQCILDLASGTGDLALEMLSLKPVKIYSADISEGMLKIARLKFDRATKTDIFECAVFPAEKIPFTDNLFDAVTIGFGIRNFENPETALEEIFRVLKPGGVLAVLEFGEPENSWWKALYHFYQRFFMAPVGKLISRHQSAYSYLKDSSRKFSYGVKFASLCERHGLQKKLTKKLQGGIAYLYIHTKF